eukprot:4517809-Pyramimonas_sp.AAC.1
MLSQWPLRMPARALRAALRRSPPGCDMRSWMSGPLSGLARIRHTRMLSGPTQSGASRGRGR